MRNLCTNCGSEDIALISDNEIDYYECNDCGFYWIAEEPDDCGFY